MQLHQFKEFVRTLSSNVNVATIISAHFLIHARSSQLILLRKVRDLRYIIEKNLPLTVPSEPELMHHLL